MMPTNNSYIFIIIGLVAIAALSVYIFKKITEERLRRSRLAELEQQANDKIAERRAYLIESVNMVAHALITDPQMTSVEAAIRLHMLLDSLEPSLLTQVPCTVISDVFKKTEHIPIKEKWKSLDKKVKRKFEQEMKEIDKEYSEQLQLAAKHIQLYEFGEK